MSKQYDAEKQAAAEDEAYRKYRRAILVYLDGNYAPGAHDIARTQSSGNTV